MLIVIFFRLLFISVIIIGFDIDYCIFIDLKEKYDLEIIFFYFFY